MPWSPHVTAHGLAVRQAWWRGTLCRSVYVQGVRQQLAAYVERNDARVAHLAAPVTVSWPSHVMCRPHFSGGSISAAVFNRGPKLQRTNPAATDDAVVAVAQELHDARESLRARLRVRARVGRWTCALCLCTAVHSDCLTFVSTAFRQALQQLVAGQTTTTTAPANATTAAQLLPQAGEC